MVGTVVAVAIQMVQVMMIEEAGGGSGWVFTEESYNNWSAGNPTDADKYELDDDYYLDEAVTIAGSSSFPSPNGETETGHSGNGFVRIACLEKLQPAVPGDVSGRITNLTNKGMQLSAKIRLKGEVDYSKTKFVFTTSANALGTEDASLYSDGNISSSNTVIKKEKPLGEYYLHILVVGISGIKKEVISDTTAISADEIEFTYAGSVESYEITATGKYRLEVYGAQGGFGRNETASGGFGGYASGEIELHEGDILYIAVGGKGKDGVVYNTTYSGGFNGGGTSHTDGATMWGSGRRCYSYCS